MDIFLRCFEVYVGLVRGEIDILTPFDLKPKSFGVNVNPKRFEDEVKKGRNISFTETSPYVQLKNISEKYLK